MKIDTITELRTFPPVVDYQPHPRWPRHVVDLALAIAGGEDCFFALHDALLELGLVECAGWVATTPSLGATRDGLCHSCVVSMILENQPKSWWMIREGKPMREVMAYLEGP